MTIIRAMRARSRLLGLVAALLLGLALLGHQAQAQNALRIDIAGVGARQIPVAIAPFDAGPGQEALSQTINNVIRANLARSGMITLIDAGRPSPALNEESDIEPLFANYRAKGADALAIGSVKSVADSRVETRFILVDTLKGANLGGLAIESPALPLDARRTAHRISDFIYEKLTGEPGFFSSRLAFIRRDGQNYSLIISDSDGQNTQVALRSKEPIISLAWSPDGSKLAYVSFESGKAVVYVHTLQTGKRITLANERGSNSAPAWSPDGSRLAVVLSRDGISQIYLVNAEGGGFRRLTSSNSIDTEPSFSADGRFVYFTSDRGGSPQIYRVSASGGDAQRVTFNGGFNARPQASPDGKYLAYVARRDGGFKIALLNLSNQQETILSNGPKDDSPSFAPNSRWVIYSSRTPNGNVLVATSLDGKLRTRLSADGGEVRGPAWGKLP